jgi:hypothetical protein
MEKHSKDEVIQQLQVLAQMWGKITEMVRNNV